jgi:hypothetical protein
MALFWTRGREKGPSVSRVRAANGMALTVHRFVAACELALVYLRGDSREVIHEPEESNTVYRGKVLRSQPHGLNNGAVR